MRTERELLELPTCAHCLGVQVGFAGIGDQVLCHPDYGIDCYRLVTIYSHAMPCPACRDARLLLDGMDPQFARTKERRS